MIGSPSTLALLLAIVLPASGAMAAEAEDPLLAAVDARNHPPAASSLARPAGERLTLSLRDETLTFTVPDGCTAWPLGDNGTSLAMSCSKARWPKLTGTVILRLARKQPRFKAFGAEPSDAESTDEGFRIETRISLASGTHEGQLQASCRNSWDYCNGLAAEGFLEGERTMFRFTGSTWDAATARTLGRSIAAATSFGADGQANARD